MYKKKRKKLFMVSVIDYGVFTSELYLENTIIELFQENKNYCSNSKCVTDFKSSEIVTFNNVAPYRWLHEVLW